MTDIEFQHNGTAILYRRDTVRAAMEATRILRLLLVAYGYIGEENAATAQQYNNFDEYSAAMARTTTDAAWWANSTMTPEQVKQAYELFLEQDEELYLNYRQANEAIRRLRKIEAEAEVTPHG